MLNFSRHIIISLLLLYLSVLSNTALFACTRILKVGPNQSVMVGRNMDWEEDMKTNLFVYPRGKERTGSSANPLRWAAKYGSIVATAYENITTDGMNEKGLATHILWLDEANYGERDEQLPGLSVAMWAQFYLDNFQTVAEAVQFTETIPFQLVAFYHEKTKRWVNLHLAMEDASGDSAIIEYIEGKRHIYHHRQYTVLTNSPTYDQQIKHLETFAALNENKPLPGSTNSVDRFIRGSFYSKRLPETQVIRHELAGLMSVMQNVAQPYGVPTPERDDIANTIWSVVADLTHHVYYYRASDGMNMIWAQLDKFHLQAGAPVMKLDLENNPDLSGDVTHQFTAIG